MVCPHCLVDLQPMERQGIEIDYCPQCRGVWLDRGELDKIIDRSISQFAPPKPSQQEHGTHGAYGKPYKGKKKKDKVKSILEEIFDF